MKDCTRILVVEDSKFFSNVICKTVLERIDAAIVPAFTLAQAQAAVEHAERPFNLALVDLILPDAADGEAVEWLLGKGVPCIVFTSIYSDDMRERLLAQNVIDYVVKSGTAGLDYLINLVERIHRNRDIKVLVVDDSRAARQYIGDLLASYQFQVAEASCGADGLAILDADPEIRLVITDYHMPDMDGVELVKRIRQHFSPDRLAVIGISSGGGNFLSAKFIKFGANDYLNKPFLREEFFCRVSQNVKMLELIQNLGELATKDALTGIHNRRFLLSAGETLFANAKRHNLRLTVAMVDIDYFKKVNDTYGHDGGDAVLRQVAHTLRHLCRQTDIVVRHGGEEFAILSVNLVDAREFFEKVRHAIEEDTVDRGINHIKVTASFGVCDSLGESLGDMLKAADALLYQAKMNGRNRVEADSGVGAVPSL